MVYAGNSSGDPIGSERKLTLYRATGRDTDIHLINLCFSLLLYLHVKENTFEITAEALKDYS